MRHAALALLLLLVSVGGFLTASALQEGGALSVTADEATKVVVLPPRHEPVWDTVRLKHDAPTNLFTAPEGMRFVLTDLITFPDRDYALLTRGKAATGAASETDRIRLEMDDAEGNTREILDKQSGGEPLHWEGGVAIPPFGSLWMTYTFVDDREHSRDELRVVHFTGYLEDAR